MDTSDARVREELNRRLRTISTDEVGDPVHAPLPRADLVACIVIVVLSIVVGVLAAA